jgi:hypothetical protein
MQSVMGDITAIPVKNAYQLGMHIYIFPYSMAWNDRSYAFLTPASFTAIA